MRLKFHAALAVVALFCLLPFVPLAQGQSIYGTMYGTVTDSSGAVVPGATVTVTDVTKNTSTKVQTNATGNYTVQNLSPDTYDVSISFTGFKTYAQRDIHLYADTSMRIDASLTAGGSSQTVEVNANALPQLKTDHADVSTILSSQAVQNLPVGGRNFTNLQLLLPGAQLLPWSHAADENPQGSAQIQIDGQAFGGVAYSLDGTDNQDPILGIIVINPNLDSLKETKITTQNFDAQFGKAVSAFMQAETKSGSNQFHGSLFDFRTSTANLAKDPYNQFPAYGNNPASIIAPGLKNLFGGSLGGPIIKDKLFFFADYQGTRQRIGTSASTIVPTAHVMSTCLGNSVASNGVAGCDFSEYNNGSTLNYPIYYNNNGVATEYPGDVVPAAQLSQPALNYLNLISNIKPNKVGASGLLDTFVQGGTGILNSDQWDERVDYQVSATAHAFERFSRFTDTLTGQTLLGTGGGPGFGLGGYGGNSAGHNDSLAAGMDIGISPTLLTDFRLGYYRYNIGDSKFDQSVQEMNNLGWGGLNISGQPITGGLAGFQISMPNGGQTEWGAGLNINRCNCPLIEREDQFQLVNNWTKIIGNHTVKFGADLRYARNLRVPSDTDRTGLFGFNSGATADASGNGGLGLASFVLGDSSQFGRYVSTSTNAKEFQKRDFFFAQDTWRVTPKLTLNYGTRYEYYSPERVNGKGNGALMDLKTGYLHVAGIGNNGLNMGWKAGKNTWNPRLGISYQVNDKTVIRAGYGRSFDLGVFGSIFGHVVTQNLPVLANQEISGIGNNAVSYTKPFDLATGPAAEIFPAVPSNGLLPNPGYAVNTKARPNPLRLPTLDAWNLSVQRAITPTLSITVAYVGNKGTHTLSAGDGNNTNPNEPAIFLPAQYSITGAPLHYDPNGGTCWPAGPGCTNPIGSNGAVATSQFLQRYYGGTLPACQDAAYAQPAGLPTGACGWTQGISYYADDQDTHYNALQITVTKRMARGLMFSSNFSYAHSINTNSSYSTWNKKPEIGNDDYTRRMSWVTYGMYDLPFGRNQRFLAGAPTYVNEVIGGWELSPVINISSGLPFTLGMNNCASSVGGTSAPCYPNGSSSHLHMHLGKFNPVTHLRPYFSSVETGSNTLCPSNSDPTGTPAGGFTCPALDQIGNSGRNNAWGPGLWNVDTSLMKNFPIKERISAQFRVDFFNLFNHIAAANPNTGNVDSNGNVTNGAGGNGVGQVGQASPRQLTFSARLQF
ncbi:MAG TPA: TonB-dependent receptor [Acidobacteriaceae bacterium]|nr:TonB-dependent receptor [Acidobacteriaceae bacterium]